MKLDSIRGLGSLLVLALAAASNNTLAADVHAPGFSSLHDFELHSHDGLYPTAGLMTRYAVLPLQGWGDDVDVLKMRTLAIPSGPRGGIGAVTAALEGSIAPERQLAALVLTGLALLWTNEVIKAGQSKTHGVSSLG